MRLLIVFHWIGSAGILYIICNIAVDIFTSKKSDLKSLVGRVVALLILWLILART